jgi:hypothetical protein
MGYSALNNVFVNKATMTLVMEPMAAAIPHLLLYPSNSGTALNVTEK